MFMWVNSDIATAPRQVTDTCIIVTRCAICQGITGIFTLAPGSWTGCSSAMVNIVAADQIGPARIVKRKLNKTQYWPT
jgi:hypothetical protein